MNQSDDYDTVFTADETAAASGVFRLLGRLWFRELDQQMVEQLRSEPLCTSYQQAGGSLPEPGDVSLEEYAIDYCQLFVGPKGHAPPVQSVWTAGKFQDDTVVSMRRYLGLLGDLDCWSPAESIVDQLGIQLDVMGVILAEMEASRTTAPERFSSLQELAGSFFREHLCWPAKLFETCQSRAQTGFYRDLIGMTECFLQTRTVN